MMKHEFEHLAMRKDAEISPETWKNVEYFYMSDNDYHKTHGDVDETKYEFVQRVFGGKINTPRTIAIKLAEESIRENRYALKDCPVPKETLKQMDDKIRDHYMSLYRNNI